MHPIKSAGAAMLFASVSLGAQAAVSEQEVADLKQQVQALLARVEQLEARNHELAAGAGPAARMEALEVRVAEVEATNEAQTDRLAQAAAFDRTADWAGKLKWKGDFRYRHEAIQEEDRADRTRHRIRGRIGLEAKVTDTIKAYVGVATGDPTDPRSTNATLGGGGARKNIALDYGYVDWTAFDGAVVSLGKMKYPFERFGGSLFYDSDVNPEGASIRYSAGNGLFGSAYGFWIDESGSGADANVFGAQLGWAGAGGLKLAVSYNDYGAIQRNSAGLVDLGGNSTYTGDRNCNLPAAAPTVACYLYDYDILGVGAEYAFQLGVLPVALWADYLENTAADDLNQGYNLGFRLGKASDPGSWELALLYQDVEKDAQWGGVIDSDFAGGATQGKGLQLRGGWVPTRNVALNLTYFDNVRSYDTPSEKDYERLQLDFSFKF